MMKFKAINCKNSNLKLQENIYSFKMTVSNKIIFQDLKTFYLRPLSLLLNHFVALFVNLIWPYFDHFFGSAKPRYEHTSTQVVLNDSF